MDDEPDPTWTVALQQAGGGVRPTSGATEHVLREVRRRQRRRRQVGLAGFTGAAVLALVVAVVAARPDDRTREDRHVATDENVGDDLFSCGDNPVFTSTTDPPAEAIDQRTLDPVLRAARRGIRGLEGSSGISYWTSSGAILVQWKEPVPDEVRALENLTFPDGGRIIVHGVPFSEKELHAAQLQAIREMRSGEVPGEWTTASACGDRTGIVVGVEPASLGDQRARIQDELADIVGLPVMVVPQEAAILQPGRIEP